MRPLSPESSPDRRAWTAGRLGAVTWPATLLFLAIAGCGGRESEQPRGAAETPPQVQAGEANAPDTASTAGGQQPPSLDAPTGPFGKSDEERIDDVHTIVRAIEAYRRRTGRLPFDEAFATVPEGHEGASINVNLADAPLPEEFRAPPPGMSGSVLTTAEFLDYMRKELGPGFNLPRDPAPPPRFYQIHFDGKDYYVSAALFEPTQHTLPLADDWHKYQVGSRPDDAQKIRAVEEIE